MNRSFAFLSGALLAVMLQMNRALSARYGSYRAALFIYLIAAAFTLLLLARKRALRDAFRRVPVWMYLGGVSGVVTMLCNNLSYGHISLTSIMALGLFAQIALSLLLDRFAPSGAPGSGGRETLVGAVVSLVGVALLLDASVQDGWVYVLLSLGAGAAVIATRTVNARLAARIGTLQSALINYLTGLPLCLVLALTMREPVTAAAFRPLIWCGGILGAVNILACNYLVPRLSASMFTLLTLCGQLLCGVLLDLLFGGAPNRQELFAGALIAAGILCSHALSALRGLKRESTRSGPE